jgi:hypothetical protein
MMKYLAWTGDNLLRQVVYEGLREDKPAADVRRELSQQTHLRGENRLRGADEIEALSGRRSSGTQCPLRAADRQRLTPILRASCSCVMFGFRSTALSTSAQRLAEKRL